MPSAEIIAIGTELLLGDIQDTNTRFLARLMRELGVDLYRTMMIGDNVERIAQSVREASARANIVITTGGLGPTVDDPTRQAVAQAVGVEPEFRPELWEQIQNRFQRMGREASENNRRQAFIPRGALPVENPVGTAPSFIVELDSDHVIIAVPGVPREMEYLMEHTITPYLRRRFSLNAIIHSLVLHTAGMGESSVDELIGDLETGSNPTVGLLAHPGQIDIRITAKAETLEQARQMTDRLADEIRHRLGENIYGQDEEDLPHVVAKHLRRTGLRLAVLESGLNHLLVQRFAEAGLPPGSLHEITTVSAAQLYEQALDRLNAGDADLVLAARLVDEGDRRTLNLVLLGPQFFNDLNRSHSGPQPLSPQWAANTALDFVRRTLTHLTHYS